MVTYAETRGNVKIPRVRDHVDHNKRQDPNAMEVDAFSKGAGGKGGGKGGPKGQDGKGWSPKPSWDKLKETRECWICGKTGHLGKDCWWKDAVDKKKGFGKDPKGKGKGDKGKGKGKGGKGKKGANSLEEGAECSAAQAEPEPEGRDTAALEMCSVDLNSTDKVEDGSWIKLNLDSGSAGTVFPIKANYGVDIEGGKTVTYKTATAELVESAGGIKVKGQEFSSGQMIEVKGMRAPVHKPLLAAGDVTNKGSDIYLWNDGGYIITKSSPILADLRACFAKSIAKHGTKGMVEACKEGNVYNVYLKVKSENPSGEAQSLNANTASGSGGPRQDRSP